MKKKTITVIAVLSALTAAAALAFVFRDKLKALFDRLKDRFCCCCSCDCEADESCEDFEEAPDSEESIEEKSDKDETAAAETEAETPDEEEN